MLETDAKKSELTFQAVMAIKNDFRAFWRVKKSFIMKNPLLKDKARCCSLTSLRDIAKII